MRGSEKKATKTGRRPRRGTPSRKGASGPVCRRDEFVVGVPEADYGVLGFSGDVQVGPFLAKEAIGFLSEHPAMGYCVYRLVEVPLAKVKAQAAGEGKARGEVAAALKKISDWLGRQATIADERAKDLRFQSLADAYAADARNYRAMAADAKAALAKCAGG